MTSKRCSGMVLPYVAFLDMGFRVEVSGDSHCLAVNVKAVGVVQVGKMVEEVAHAAAHVEDHFRIDGRKHLHHIPAYFMRSEELSHLELFFGIGILVIVGEVGLL